MGLLSKLFGKREEKPPFHLTDENWQKEVLESELPVVVDFWGPNCAPCDQLAPIMMQLAAKYDGRVKICEAKIGDNRRSAGKHRIMGTPTVLYFRPRGKLVERVVGFRGWLYHDEIITTDLLPRE